MTTTLFLYAILYAGGLVFIVACAVRAIGYARLPLHLRWELYPVPHEKKERVRHGGSYFETPEWWKEPVAFNYLNEWKSMFAEILFLKGLWEFKRKMWYRSYLFHLGLYLLIGAAGLLFATAFISIIAPQTRSGKFVMGLHYAYTTVGLLGAGLTLVGAAALLVERLTEEDLKPFTTLGDLFNLSFFIVTVGFLSAGYFLRPETSPGALALAQGVLTFDLSLKAPFILELGLVLGALLAAYIPMTHMSHFIAKYFTYHAIRWDDAPNRRGAKLEQKLAEYLTYRPTWSAPHVGANGSKSWAEIAMTNPAQGGKK
jgi:nitrate reductase gamma subunit